MTKKLSKDEVDYSPGMPRSHCGPMLESDRYYCQHFSSQFRGKPYKQGICTVVAGPIRNDYWCKKYERNKS